jgi:hypothetical protein
MKGEALDRLQWRTRFVKNPWTSHKNTTQWINEILNLSVHKVSLFMFSIGRNNFVVCHFCWGIALA